MNRCRGRSIEKHAKSVLPPSQLLPVVSSSSLKILKVMCMSCRSAPKKHLISLNACLNSLPVGLGKEMMNAVDLHPNPESKTP